MPVSVNHIALYNAGVMFPYRATWTATATQCEAHPDQGSHVCLQRVMARCQVESPATQGNQAPSQGFPCGPPTEDASP